MVDDTGSDHKSRVDGSTNNSAKWIPCSVIKPVVEIVEALFCQVLGCTIVEVRIKLMDDRFKPENRKKPGREGKYCCNRKDCEFQQILLLFHAEAAKDGLVQDPVGHGHFDRNSL